MEKNGLPLPGSGCGKDHELRLELEMDYLYNEENEECQPLLQGNLKPQKLHVDSESELINPGPGIYGSQIQIQRTRTPGTFATASSSSSSYFHSSVQESLIMIMPHSIAKWLLVIAAISCAVYFIVNAHAPHNAGSVSNFETNDKQDMAMELKGLSESQSEFMYGETNNTDTVTNTNQPKLLKSAGIITNSQSKLIPEKDTQICLKNQNQLGRIKTELNISNLYDRIFPLNPYSAESLSLSSSSSADESNEVPFKNPQKKLNIFVVLHSHNDAGWVKTFQNYYEEETKNILNNVLKYLTLDPSLKFVWCEMSFFDLWWKDLGRNKRIQVKELVKKGQLGFVGGGWVMHDQATPHYFSMITQLMEGHQWLKQHLNYKPRTGWAIDPFGLSSTSQYLLKRSGLESTVFSRIHYLIRELLVKEKNTEFYWRQSWDVNRTTDILAYLMPYGTYDRGSTCGPDSDTCMIYSSSESIEYKALWLLGQYRKKAEIFKTQNLLVPIGSDFSWQSEYEWAEDIKNLKDIFKFINSHQDFNAHIKFATVDEYFDAVRRDLDSQDKMGHYETIELFESGAKPKTKDDLKNKLGRMRRKGHPWKVEVKSRSNSQVNVKVKLPVFSGDFFPYASENQNYWSGFYTSRIFHKTSERKLMSLVRSAQLIYTVMAAEISKEFSNLDFRFIGEMLQKIVESRRILSLFQHHDGITGTSKDHVMNDYAFKLFHATQECSWIIQKGIHVLQIIRQNHEKKMAGEFENKFILKSELKFELDKISRLSSKKSGREEIPEEERFYSPILNPENPGEIWKHKILYIGPDNPVETIAIFNPLAKTRKQIIKILVSNPNVKVISVSNEKEIITSEIYPYFNEEIFDLKKQFKIMEKTRQFQLCFVAEFSPLEIKYFKIIHSEEELKNSESSSVHLKILQGDFTHSKHLYDFPFTVEFASEKHNSDLSISNDYLKINFNSTGLMESVEMEGNLYPVSIAFLRYRTVDSGLYIFIPEGQAEPINQQENIFTNLPLKPTVIIVKGKLQSYVEISYPSTRLKHRVTLHNTNANTNSNYPPNANNAYDLDNFGIHVENTIDIKEKYNYELIMRIQTEIHSENAFFTDSNGFQMMPRQRRENVPIQGNYFPVASSAFIEDSKLRLTLLAGQPGGCSSLTSGQIEIMQDRIINQDDGKGVGQGGTDNLLTISKFQIILERPMTSSHSCSVQSESQSQSRFENSNSKLPLLSLGTNVAQLNLLHPLLVYKKENTSNSQTKFVDYSLTAKLNSANAKDQRSRSRSMSPSISMSCDIHLLGAMPLAEFTDSSISTFPREAILNRENDTSIYMSPLSQSALLFHRFGFDSIFTNGKFIQNCFAGDSNLNSNSGWGHVKINELFSGLFKQQLQQTSLTLTHKKGYVDGSKNLKLEPMEINAFIGFYSNSYKLGGSRSKSGGKTKFESVLPAL